MKNARAALCRCEVPAYAPPQLYALCRVRRRICFRTRGDANGGLLLNPELGVQYALRCGVHLFFAAGYELQRLERLRKYEGRWFSAEFAERLSHGTLLLKVGVLF